jgi:hypothetical protein
MSVLTLFRRWLAAVWSWLSTIGEGSCPHDARRECDDCFAKRKFP